jgi:hypothetical protein
VLEARRALTTLIGGDEADLDFLTRAALLVAAVHGGPKVLPSALYYARL